MMKYLSLLLFLGYWVVDLHAQSQSFVFEHLTTADGLVENSSYAILQDHQGFLWVGTQNGLHRYDGYDLSVVYQPDPERRNLVLSLEEDRTGTLWVGTRGGGLYRFDRATQTFTRYAHDAKNPTGLRHPSVKVIYADQDGGLWIGTGDDWTPGKTGGGVSRFDPATEMFTHYLQELPEGAVTDILEDQEGSLWVATSHDGVKRLNQKHGTVTHFRHNPNDPGSLASNAVQTLCVDRKGNLWVGTWGGGLDRFDPESQSFIHHREDANDPQSLSNDFVRALVEDGEGVLWVGTHDGVLNQMDPATGTFSHYQYNPNDPTSFHGGRGITALYEDRQGILWIGTWLGGVNKLDRSRSKFSVFRYNALDPNNMIGKQVMSIYEDRAGALWIGTGTFRGQDTGLNRLDRQTGAVTHFRHDPYDPGSLGQGAVTDILEDREGALWVVTFGNGLNRLDKATSTFTHFRHDLHDPGSLAHNTIRDIFMDRAGQLWVATFGGGLDRFDPKTSSFIHHRHDPNSPTSLSHDQVSHLYEDRQGTLWISTNLTGLNKYDPDTGVFTHYPFDANDPLNYHTILKIHEDRSGRFWLGTLTSGLYLFDRSTLGFTSYTVADGLAHQGTWNILEDDTGALWIGTYGGLSRFDPLTGSFRNYDVTDGLPSNMFTWEAASHKSDSGELFFGLENGYISFYPDQVSDNPYVPPIVLTAFRLSKKTLDASPLETQVSVGEEITLAHHQNDFSFAFASLNYRHTEKNRYKYKLEPYDEQWQEVGTQRTATYTNIPPGAYRFTVQGSNNDGVWNEEGASVHLVISPPWWQRWWFRLLTGTLLLAMLTAAYRYRVNRLLEMERMRLRIASDLHDDVGSTLSAIAMRSEMLRDRALRGRVEGHELHRISQAAEETIATLREIVWFIDPKHDRLDDLVDKMRNVAADLLNGTPYTFEAPDLKVSRSLSMGFRRQVFLIYKEALHNVVRHARASRVTIRLESRDGQFVLQIEDDGVGFEKAKAQQGHGLRNMQRRAAQIGGRLEVESTLGRGAVITLAAKMA